MDSSLAESLKYPIGKFTAPGNLSSDQRKGLIEVIEQAPGKYRQAVTGLTDQQFDTPYREGGWTIRQVIHHVADSHLNSYIRFKWALTEEKSLIKTYNQTAWANLPEAKSAPVDLSLNLLEALHARWVVMLKNMTEEDFSTKFTHPELGEIDLHFMLGLYAWHCKHHLAHIHQVGF